jgi:hypothetical protein
MVYNCRADPVQIVDENGNILGGSFQSLVITDEWTVSLIKSETVGNSKVFDVPNGTEYQILWIYVEYTSVAGADRQLQIDIRDNEGDIIGDIRPGVVQAASLVYSYMFAPSLADLTAVRDTVYIMTPFPPTVFLPASYSIRVFDNNGVDALDTIDVQMMIASRPA